MRPVRLILNNFTSFKGEVVIDFSEKNLFAIVGPTGSGKSSILDAIVFALFGKMPRFSDASPNRHLISLGEKKASVTLEWIGRNARGGEDQLYRIERSIGSKSQVTFQGMLSDGRWIAVDGASGKIKDTEDRIVERVGLDYSEFCAVAFLPQGKFAQLLQGKGETRREILGKLFDGKVLEEMRKYAGDRLRKLESGEEALRQRLQNECAGVGEDALSELRGQQESGRLEISRLSGEQQQLQNRLTGLQNVQKLQQDLDVAQERLQRHFARQGEMEADRRRAAEARQFSKILPFGDRVRRAEKELQRARGNLQEDSMLHVNWQEQFTAALARFEAASRGLDKVETLQQEQAGLQGAERLAERLRSLPQAEPTDRRLPWSEEAYATAQADLHAETEWQRQATDFVRQRQRHDETAERLKAQEDDHQKASAKLELMAEEGRAKKAAIASLEQEIESLKAKDMKSALAAHAHLLQEGQPCPLCGSLDHPNPLQFFDNKEFDRLQMLLKQRTNELHEFADSYRSEKGRLDAGRQMIDRAREELASDLERLNEAEKAHLAHKPHHDDAPAQRMNDLVAGLAAELAPLGERPLDRLEEIRGEIATIQSEFSNAKAAHSRQEAELQAAQNALEGSEREVKAREDSLNESKSALQDMLAAEGLEQLGENEIARMALPEDEILAIDRRVAVWESTSVGLQENFNEAKSKLEATSTEDFSDEALGGAECELQSVTARIAELQRQGGVLDNQIEGMVQKLELQKQLKGELATSEKSLQLWKELHDQLKGDNFPAFKMSIIERQLLAAANRTLSDISEDRYQLKLSDDESDAPGGKARKRNSTITVVDNWQAEGANERDVKTLSGGETFLASLSLAIALSDFMADNKTASALFLDEGFGTLDPTALDAVREALERLKESGRMIGIVTHVEALSKGIPALVVSKDKSGSAVEFHSQYYPSDGDEVILKELLQP